jgi:subtilisin family serine protease
MRRFSRLLTLLVVLMLALASMAVAAPKETKESYLVGLRQGASAKALGIDGVDVTDEWPDLNAAAVKVTPAALKALQKHSSVAYVEPDPIRKTMGLSDGEYTWGLQAVSAPKAWKSGATGSGIKVCILDTGIDPSHPEFFRNGESIIKEARDFTPSASGTFSVHPHGTHVAGTIAGQLDASGSKIGVAPGVDLYIAKVLDDTGNGRTSWILNGVRWCVEKVQANVLSLSLGGGTYTKTEEAGFQAAYDAGALVIAAAGNDGNGTVSYPAGYGSVASVAAVDANLNKADFSQYNADVELAGPGVHVLSSVPVGTGATVSVSEGSDVYGAALVEYAPNDAYVAAPLVECGIADTTASCTGAPAGDWIAMISRGSISFAAKVTNVMAQGAAAAIIANNDQANPDDGGGFTLGAAGSWIPTVSVSYNSGVAIRAGGLGTGNVTVTPSNYDYYNGTSMATPHVSAVAALAWSVKQSLTNAQIRTILQNTAMDLGPAGRDINFGYGLVQADKAAAAAARSK